jgi:hypothetical protein
MLLEEYYSVVDTDNDKYRQFKYYITFFDNVKFFGFTGSYSDVA